jgi:maltooligosyltrehalose trehalohydrolase
VIAETNQNDARITATVEAGGHGLDGVWSDDFHHCVHSLLTGERDGYYVDFGDPLQLAKTYRDVFAYDGCFSPFSRRRHGSRVTGQPRERFVVCVQNHDQIGNRALGDRLGTLVSPARQRLAAALLLISPNTPLLFMGEEYGEKNPFAFFCSFEDPALIESVCEGRKREFAELAFRWGGDLPDAHAESTFEAAKVSWDWASDASRGGLRLLYSTLLSARRSWPPLIDRERTDARVVEAGSAKSALLVVERGGPAGLLAVANLTGEPAPLPPGAAAGRAPLLSTAERRFGGGRDELQSIDTLAAHELCIWGNRAWK